MPVDTTIRQTFHYGHSRQVQPMHVCFCLRGTNMPVNNIRVPALLGAAVSL